MARSKATSAADPPGPRWTAKQRAALEGARHPHRLDPPAPPRTREEGWQAVRRLHSYPRPPLRYADDRAEAEYAPRIASFAEELAPAQLDPLTERLRAYLLHAEMGSYDLLPAAALYPFWCGTAGLGFVFDVFRSPVLWAYGARDLRPWDLGSPEAALAYAKSGGVTLALGHTYGGLGHVGPTLAPLRRFLFALEDDAWATALAQGRAWLEARAPLSDPQDDLTERAFVTWLLARDPSLAEALTREALAAVKVPGKLWSLMLVSLTERALVDEVLARKGAEALYYLPPTHALALVDTFGAEAAPVLQAMLEQLALRRGAKHGQKELRAALELAETGRA